MKRRTLTERNHHLATIQSLVTQEEITTQQMLQERLAAQGIHVTQATLSRDIHTLNLIKKRRNDGVLYYTMPTSPHWSESSEDIWRNAFLYADYAGNIAVLHCRTGTAGAVCVALDELDHHDVVGTIAGDDTVFVLLRTPQLARQFATMFPKGDS